MDALGFGTWIFSDCKSDSMINLNHRFPNGEQSDIHSLNRLSIALPEDVGDQEGNAVNVLQFCLMGLLEVRMQQGRVGEGLFATVQAALPYVLGIECARWPSELQQLGACRRV